MIKYGEYGVAWMKSCGWALVFVVGLGHAVLLNVYIMCLYGAKNGNKNLLIPFMIFKSIWILYLVGGGIFWMHLGISTGLVYQGISTENMMYVFIFGILVAGTILNMYFLAIVVKLCIEIDSFTTEATYQAYQEPFI